MAYSDFNFKKLKKLGLTFKTIDLGFRNLAEIELNKDFLYDFEFSNKMNCSNEKSKGELIFAPIIRTLKRDYKNEFTPYIGYPFTVDKEQNLTGICDYLLTKTFNINQIEPPIFLVIEAKHKSTKLAQCIAQLYASAVFNKQLGYEEVVVYGAFTNATEWLFLKLENNIVYIDTQTYYLSNLPKLLGILNHIIKQVKN